jgi:hypothetical protein
VNSIEPIEVLSHFQGKLDVSALSDLEIATRQAEPAPPSPGIEPPEVLKLEKDALQDLKPGELLVVADDESKPNSPLILASNGRKANLADQQDLIETARSAGRPVQIHVFDDLDAIS